MSPVVAPMSAPALAVLETASADLEVTLRRRALELLVRLVPDEGGGQYALRGLYDPNPYVKQAVADALLLRTQDPVSHQRLVEFVMRDDVDDYSRGSIALDLALDGYQDHAPVIAQAWRVAGDGWAAAPLALAAAVMGDTSAVDALGAMLREGEFPLEIAFFLDLGRSGLVDLVPSMEAALASVEEELRLPLAASLVDLQSDCGARVFQDALRSDDVMLALDAIDYLGQMEGPVAWRLMRLARRNRHPVVKRYADLVLLGRGFGNARVAVRSFQSDDRELRAMALDSLAAGCASGACQALARRTMKQALADEELQVLLAAVGGMAAVGRAQDQALLLPLLDHDDWLVRVEAAGALLVLASGSPAAVEQP